jgi:WD40 repeat protein/serine/threonine protein kinase
MSPDPVVGAAPEQQLRLAGAELERRLRAGQPCRTEELLAAFPALAADKEAALELIYTEHVLREELGQRLSLAEWSARFPQWRTDLKQLFQVHQCARITSIPPPSSEGTTLPGGQEQLADRSGSGRARRLGNYELLQEIGRGGMGVVYKARQVGLDRVVALKVILADDHASAQEVARFRHEAEAVARLQHSHIVQIYEVGEQDGRRYFSLEYVDGGNLEKKLAGTPLPARQAAELVEKLAQAMQHAHQQGIVHRDLKPANVLLTAAGVPKVTDFGLAKRLEAEAGLTQSGAIVGTPSYMAPEQAAGDAKEIGPAADVHALGAILYECLTGRPPFQGASVPDTLGLVRFQEAVPPRRLQPKVPPDLETICLKCLQKERPRRYTTAQALADDLRRFLDGRPVLARPVSATQRAWRWGRRNPGIASLVVAVTFSLLAGTAASTYFGLKATEQAKQALAQRGQAEWQAANRLYEHSLARCLQEDAGRGVLWLTHSLREARRVAAPDLEDAVRLQLGAWESHLHILLAVCPHQGQVNAVAFSPDGKIFLTGSVDKTARLWDAATGKALGPPLKHEGAVWAAAFSPDGKIVLTCSGADKTVRLWEVSTGKCLVPPWPVPGGVQAVAFSPDGKVVLTGGHDGTAKLWEVATGRPQGPPLRHRDPVFAVAFSPDGKTVLTCSWDKTARLWEAATGKPLGSPLQHEGQVWAIAFSPDGKIVLTGSEDQTAQRWETATGKAVGTPLQHQGGVMAVAFSPDGKQILTGSYDHTARLWETATGKETSLPLLHQEAVDAVAFSPDGRLALTGSRDQTARLWDAHTGRPVGAPLVHQNEIGSVAFSPDGKQVVTASADHTARLWQLATGKNLGLPLQHPGVGKVAFADEGRALLTAGTEIRGVIEEVTARLWEADTGKPLGPMLRSRHTISRPPLGFIIVSHRLPRFTPRTAPLAPDGVTVLLPADSALARPWDLRTGEALGPSLQQQGIVAAMSFSPDGNAAVTCTADGTVQVWDTRTWTALGPPLRHEFGVRAVAFSPDSKILLTGGGKTARLWEAATGQPLTAPLPTPAEISSAAFSPDGKVFLTVSMESTAQLWETATGQPLGPPLRHQKAIYGAAFSPDSATILTGSDDGTARLWQAATGKPLGLPLQHRDGVWAVAFSPNGKVLLTGSYDRTARLWEAATGRALGPPLEHPASVNIVAFCPDGHRLVTGCHDGLVRFWQAPAPMQGEPERLVLWAEVVTGMELDDAGAVRVLDAEEWQSRRRQLAELDGFPPPDP